MGLTDIDFKCALTENFSSNKELEELYIDTAKLSEGSAEIASEITSIYNVVSTAATVGYSFKQCMAAIDTEVQPKYVNYKRTLSLIYEWVRHVEPEYVFYGEVGNMGAETAYALHDDPVTSWDEYFFGVARQAARNSKCFSRRIGAVVVRDKSVIGTGYNSPPRGVPTCDLRWDHDKSLGPRPADKQLVATCPRKVLGYRSGEGIEICPASHAEESAIINCARMGISAKDAKLYLTCFTEDTEVVTDSGTKQIKNISVGDKVLSKTGKFNKVLKVHKNKSTEKIYTVKLKGIYNTFSCTESHVLFGKKAATCKYPNSNNRSCFLCPQTTCANNISDLNFHEITAGALTAGDYLYVPKLVTQEYKHIDTRNMWSRTNRKDIPEEFFYDSDYFWSLGLYIAEGSSMYTKGYAASIIFSLNINEETYIVRLKNFFEKYSFNVSLYFDEGNNRVNVSIHSSELCNHYVELCGKLAENKKIHNALLYTNKALDIISGIQDGDGTTIKNQKSITTVSALLASQLVQVLAFNGFNVRQSIEEAKVDKNGINHKRIHRVFYSDSNINQVNIKKGFIKVESVQVLPPTEGHVYDLTVDNDASYTVGIVAVHNCGIPCGKCAVKIINAGIKEVVVTSLDQYDLMSQYLFDHSDVKLRVYGFIS